MEKVLKLKDSPFKSTMMFKWEEWGREEEVVLGERFNNFNLKTNKSLNFLLNL